MNSREVTVIDLDPYTFGPTQTCFGCGPHNERGLRLRFQREGDAVTTRFVLGKGHDGPPDLLHGGLQALICDELAGWVLVGLRDRIGVTSSMNLRYIRGIRLGEECVGIGELASEADGMMAVDDVILGADGTGAEPVLFTDDARKTIGLAIGEAEARSPASLKLLRWREGVTTTVTLTLETLGAYGPNAPYGTGESVLCPKTAAIIDKALNVIMTGIESNDGWNFNALALLAANDPTHPDNAARQAKAAELVQSLILSPSEIDLYTSGYVSTASKVAWSWGHKLIVLAEYYLNTGDASVLEANYRDTHFWKKQIHVGVF